MGSADGLGMIVQPLVKGEVYRIRLTSGQWIDAEYLFYERRERSWANYRAVSRWHFRNISTGREVQIKTRPVVLLLTDCATLSGGREKILAKVKY